jgi:hypothetical protein
MILSNQNVLLSMFVDFPRLTISVGNIGLMWLLLEAIICCSIDSKNSFWAENENLGK